MVQISVEVTNKSESDEIAEFYRESIDLIQCFLIQKNLLTEDRSMKLASIFERMLFYSVDTIQVLYSYKDVSRKLTDLSSTNDAFVDQESAHFYILKRFEKSEIRHKYAMTEFLVEDPSKRQTLHEFIERCQMIYQPQAPGVLNVIRQEFKMKIVPQWKIPSKKIEIEEPVSKEEAEKTFIEVTQEEINKLLEEKSSLPTKTTTTTAIESTITCVIGEKSTDVSLGSAGKTPNLNQPRSENISNNSVIATDENLLRNRAEQTCDSVVPEANDQSNQPTILSSSTENSTVSSPLTENSTVLEQEPTMNKQEQLVPIGDLITNSNKKFDSTNVSKQIRLPEINVENIVVSNLLNIDSSVFQTFSSDRIQIPSLDSNYGVGKLGEELAYRVLKSRYPNAQIEWYNEENESMKPFDIVIKFDEQHIEYVEVKTTRHSTENSFFISAREVQFFIKNPSNSSIYRVFLSEPVENSKIIEINRIVDSLNNQTLKLVMTMVSKPKDEEKEQ